MAALVAGSIIVELDALTAGFAKGMGVAKDKIEDVGKASGNLAKGGMASLQSGFSKASDMLGTGLLVGLTALGGGLVAIGKKALDSSAEMESFGLQLKTAFGGNLEMAKAAELQITKFAAKTPYDLGQVMNSFIKLKNLGLDPSERALTSYGNTASAMGKDLNQMIEAVADASTGEFERLKEFGIKSSKQGNQISFTFGGVTTKIKNDSKSIQEYLLKLGETKFAGSMEAQATSFSGLMSTMSDTVNQKLSALGKNAGILEMAKNFVTGVTMVAENIDIDGIINRVTALSLEFRDLYNQAATFLQPTLEYFSNKLIPDLKSAWESTVEAFSSFVTNVYNPLLKPSIDGIISGVVTLAKNFMDLWTVISPVVIPILEFLAKTIGVLLVGAITAILFQINGFIEMLNWLLESTTNIINGAIGLWKRYEENIMGILNGVKDYISGWINIVTGVFTGDQNKIDQGIKTMLSGVRQIFNNVFEGVKKYVSDILGGIISTAKGAIDWLNQALGKQKELTEAEKYNAKFSTSQNGNVITSIPNFASGTNFFSGGLAQVNERGGEIMNLPNGTQIIPNDISKIMASNAGSNNAASVYNLTINGNYLGTERDKRQLVRDLKDAFNQVMSTPQTV